MDADSRMMLSYMVGGRDSDFAIGLMDDLRSRIANRVQLTTDGHRAYLHAVEDAFGMDVDYAQLVKVYGEAPESEKRYSPAQVIGGARPDGRSRANALFPREQPTRRGHACWNRRTLWGAAHGRGSVRPGRLFEELHQCGAVLR